MEAHSTFKQFKFCAVSKFLIQTRHFLGRVGLSDDSTLFEAILCFENNNLYLVRVKSLHPTASIDLWMYKT